MRHITGAILLTSTLAASLLLTWRLVRGIEWWLVDSGAAHILMWSIVAALVLTIFALPAALWGLAARCWLVRVEAHQHLEHAAHIFIGAGRQRVIADFEHSNDQYDVSHS